MDKSIIQVEDLSYSYPDGNRALEDISLEVAQGESLGIIGPNGAGKTTLLLHFNGLLNGNGARVRVLGMEVGGDNLAKIRRTVGLVFQEPEDQLFMPTVYEDVSFGPINLGWDEHTVKEQTRRALEQVDLFNKRDCLSHHLSLGEKKRVSIATVLSMDPEVLVLDEPSANLDPASRKQLIELLKKLPISKIIAGHDLELILELCSRVALLSRGRVAAVGDIKSILGNYSLMHQHNLEVPLSLK